MTGKMIVFYYQAQDRARELASAAAEEERLAPWAGVGSGCLPSAKWRSLAGAACRPLARKSR